MGNPLANDDRGFDQLIFSKKVPLNSSKITFQMKKMVKTEAQLSEMLSITIFLYLKCYLIAFNPQNGGWSTSIYIRIMTGLPLLNKYRSRTVCRFSCKFRPSLFFIFCSKPSLYVSPHCCRGCLILENY